ncbi:CFI-box-CTERM domain-containing protein [Acidovorax sp. Root217]|uniref:tetratricopeptide repeat protein n=1 Tax=Acidovorax sp. Root217 TaxID=1736492 RepID=UPI000A9AAFF8|nr:CFI-box-CTERM domain-containing protein [Acidovorax sp. Root217]
MGLIALTCEKCSAQLNIDDEASTYTCKYCLTKYEREQLNISTPTPSSLKIMAERAIASAEYGKAMQFIEQGLSIEPGNKDLLSLEVKAREGLAGLASMLTNLSKEESAQRENRAEADQYQLQAQFILNELQANKKVYGSNSALTGATPANIDLALQYINRSLELFPDSPVYLNLKALLLWEGKGSKEQAAALLEKAATLAPRDINIQNNLKVLKSSPCFIATAAFGTPLSLEINILRAWRDERLINSAWGKRFVAIYYFTSPPIANFIATRPILKRATRLLLAPFIKLLSKKYPALS